MNPIYYFLILIGTFLTMEGITWLTHKYVMHGFLWALHKDHHDHSNEGPLEKNDYFFVIFALPTIARIPSAAGTAAAVADTVAFWEEQALRLDWAPAEGAPLAPTRSQ